MDVVHRSLRTGAALLVVALAGCAQPEAPADRFYRLDFAPPAGAGADPQLPGILEVERPEADGLLAGRPIVHSSGQPGTPLMEYPYDFWERAPALMVRDALVDCVQRGHIATKVVTEQTRIDARYSLIGRLIRFEQVDGAPPRALAELQLGLRDNRTDELLIWMTYREEKSALDDTMPASVNAFDEAMTEICRQFTADLAEVAPTPEDASGGRPPNQKR